MTATSPAPIQSEPGQRSPLRGTVASGSAPRAAVLSLVRERVSLRYPPCRRNPALARGIEHDLCRLSGVRSAEASPLTARVTVRFDPAGVSLDEIGATIATARPLTDHREADGRLDRAAQEIRGYRRRLFIGGVGLVGVVAGHLFLGAGALSGNPVFAVATAAAVLSSGFPILLSGTRMFAGRSRLGPEALITSATAAMLVLGEGGTALVLLFLMNLGEFLQALTLYRTHLAIRDLLSMDVKDVWLVADGAEVKVPLESIQPGDVIAVYGDEKIPVDGVVVQGNGAVNQALVTGESIAAYKVVGDPVYAGTVLELGSLRIRTTGVGADTVVGRLIDRVEQAHELRAPIETVAENFSRRFVPFSFALAGAVLLLTGDLRRAMTMLVIACPCAAGLSTPAAVSASVGNAARRGVYIKGGSHLEAAGRIDTIVLDKTGTLTTGQARVSRALALDPAYTAEDVLRLAASAELHSKHPLALAILSDSREREIAIPDHEECELIVGLGVRANLAGERILVGSERLLNQHGVETSASLRRGLSRLRTAGETALCVAVDAQVVGLIGVSDAIRPHAAETVAALRRIGITRIILCTGDSIESAAAVAGALDIAEYRGGYLPEDKFTLIQELQASGRRVGMVGDGINDAPALALANLGIATGKSGSDVAIEAADIYLASDELDDIATIIDLSQRTLAVVKQNYAMSLGVNAAGITVSSFGALNPFLASVVHNLSTIAVVVNSSQLMKYRSTGPHANGKVIAVRQPALA